MRTCIKTGTWILATALMLGSIPAFAGRDGKRGDKMGMEKRWEKMEKELGLTEEQKKKLSEHHKNHREQAKKLREEMDKKQENFRAEMEKTDFNASAVRKAHSELQSVRNKMADHRLDGMLTVREILTPEQFKKFKEKMHKKHGKMMKKDWERMKMRGEGRQMHGDRDRDE